MTIPLTKDLAASAADSSASICLVVSASKPMEDIADAIDLLLSSLICRALPNGAT